MLFPLNPQIVPNTHAHSPDSLSLFVCVSMSVCVCVGRCLTNTKTLPLATIGEIPISSAWHVQTVRNAGNDWILESSCAADVAAASQRCPRPVALAYLCQRNRLAHTHSPTFKQDHPLTRPPSASHFWGRYCNCCHSWPTIERRRLRSQLSSQRCAGVSASFGISLLSQDLYALNYLSGFILWGAGKRKIKYGEPKEKRKRVSAGGA